MAENPIQKEQRARRDKKIAGMYPQNTYQRIGDKYNLTRERVRQIINKQKNEAIRN